MRAQPVRRTVFATSRAAEFIELRALQAQTGQPVEAFGDVVIKELIDNSLDAAETAGRAPVIEIHTHTRDDITFVTVVDNGAGISAATIADVCDFNVLVSDKARYRGPARGAQGNAFKTLLGIPAALGVTEPVVVDTRWITHSLRVSVDPAGQVVVDHKKNQHRRPGRLGTSVTVPLPADLEIDPARWALGCALVNPHATIGVNNQAYDGAGGAIEKLLPPADVLAEHVQTVCDQTLTERVEQKLAELVDVVAVVCRLRDEHPDLANVVESDLRDRFDDHPTESWRASADQLVEDAVDDAELADRARELIIEQLRGRGDE
jgi:DNA topoisomerase VI subunit B